MKDKLIAIAAVLAIASLARAYAPTPGASSPAVPSTGTGAPPTALPPPPSPPEPVVTADPYEVIRRFTGTYQSRADYQQAELTYRADGLLVYNDWSGSNFFKCSISSLRCVVDRSFPGNACRSSSLQLSNPQDSNSRGFWLLNPCTNQSWEFTR
jgi:hypothetical protein